MAIQIPPLVFTLDYRVKNENSVIRSVDLANRGIAKTATTAQEAANAQDKLTARLEAVRNRLDVLTQQQEQYNRSLSQTAGTLAPLHAQLQGVEKEIASVQARITYTTRVWGQNSIVVGDLNKRLNNLKVIYSGLSPQVDTLTNKVRAEQNALNYANVQIAVKTARIKELELQLAKTAPVVQKQTGFFNSMGQALKNTFASWENFVKGVETFSVTADRLTRSGQRTINIINKISGAITGKPLLDWDKGATKAATSTTHFGTSAEKASGGVSKLVSNVTSALNPIKGLSAGAVALGTLLGNLGSNILLSITNAFANMGFAAVQAAKSIAASAISNVASYERSVKSLTALLAQEKAIGNAYDATAKQATMSADEADKLKTEHRKLTLEMQLQEQAMNNAKASGDLYGASLELQEIALAENRDRLGEMSSKLAEYNAAAVLASGSTDQLAKSTGQVRDFLKAAGPEAFQLLRWIEKLAIESPFDQEGVKNTFLMLKSFGFMAEQAKRMTSALIDWAAATGKSSFEMERVSLALSQIRNLGRLSGQEVMQLAQAGISVDRILAQAMGKTTQEIVQMREKGLIPAQEAIDAIIKQLETDWKGAAKDQAKTFSGLLSSIKDIVPILTRSFFGPMDEATGKVGGLLGAIQPYISKLVDFLGADTTVNKVREFGVRLGDWVTMLLEKGIPKLQEFGNKVLATFQMIQAKASPYIDKIRDVIETITRVIQGGVSGVGENKGFSGLFKVMEDNLPKAIQTAKVAFDTLKIVVGEVSKTWDNVFVPTVRRIAALFQVDWSKAGKTASGVLDFIQTSMAGVSEFVVLKLMPAITNLINYVGSNFPIWKQTVTDAFNTFLQKVQPIVSAVNDLWAEIQEDMPLIKDAISEMVEAVKIVWNDLWTALGGESGEGLDSIIRGITVKVESMRLIWEKYGVGIINVVREGFILLTTLFGLSMNRISLLVNVALRFLSGDWEGTLEIIRKSNKEFWKIIQDVYGDELRTLKDRIDNAWRLIKLVFWMAWVDLKTEATNFVWKLRDTIRNGLYELKDAAINIFNIMKDGVVAVWKEISFQVKSIYYALENALKLSWSRFKAEVRETWESIKEIIRQKWQEISDKVMYYVNLVKSFVTDPQARQQLIAAAAGWISGMINEIKSWASALYNAVYNLVRQAVQAAKNAFGMHSPSKVGIEIGRNFGESLIQGITQQIPRIEAAIQVAQPATAGQIGSTTVNNSRTLNQTLNMTTTTPPHSVQTDFAVMKTLAMGF